MSKITTALLPLVIIGAVMAALSFTTAAKTDFFWSHRPPRHNFTFTIDSTQHYNGNECVFNSAAGRHEWSGNDEFPVPGTECFGTWDALDKIKKHHKKFFSFSDLKPGDFGEDTISLHLKGDDACGQILIKNVTERGNTCNEPETETRQDRDCFGRQPGKKEHHGELREALLFSLWLDQGSIPGFQGSNIDDDEGNNEFDPGETYIFQDENIRRCPAVQEIRRHLRQARKLFFERCNAPEADPDGDGRSANGDCEGLPRDGRMLDEVTYYYGFAWKLPEETGNEAQTDSLKFDVEFFVKSNGQCSPCNNQCSNRQCEDSCKD